MDLRNRLAKMIAMEKHMEVVKKEPGAPIDNRSTAVLKTDRVAVPVKDVDQKKIIEYMDAFGLSSQLEENEKKQFAEIAVAYQLNPFKKEIYCIPYGTGQYRKLSIITGYEVYLKRAERTGKCAGWKAWTEGKASDDTLKAIVEIHRKDWAMPLTHEVHYSEYVQRKKGYNGKPGEITKFWKEKPVTMIKKVVVAQGFRMAFPDEMGGMPYTSDELPDDMTKLPDVKESTSPPPEPEKSGNFDKTVDADFEVVEKESVEPAETLDIPGPIVGKSMEVPKPKGTDPRMHTPAEDKGVDPPTGKPKGDGVCQLCGTLLTKGQDQYGGGWICWIKKNGCGSKYDDNIRLKDNGVSKAGALLFFSKFQDRVVNCPLNDQLFKICNGYGWEISRVEEHFGLTQLEPPVDMRIEADGVSGTEEVKSEDIPEIFPVTPEHGNV